MKIYLAGGMKSGWQDRVKEQMENYERITFIDPRKHLLTKDYQYTPVDLHGIRSCDILFGYLETSNPVGYNLAAEIGYAKGLGKTVILLLDEDRRGFSMPPWIADYTTLHFNDAMCALEGMITMEVP